MPSGNRSKTNKMIRKFIVKRIGKLSNGAKINLPEIQRGVQAIDKRLGVTPQRIASLLKDQNVHYSNGEWFKGGRSA